MIGQLNHIIDFIKTKPSEEIFNSASGINCLFCQYGEQFNLGDYQETIKYIELGVNNIEFIVSEPRTFGAALERAVSLTK